MDFLWSTHLFLYIYNLFSSDFLSVFNVPCLEPMYLYLNQVCGSEVNCFFAPARDTTLKHLKDCYGNKITSRLCRENLRIAPIALFVRECSSDVVLVVFLVGKLKFVLFNDATGTHWFLSYHRLLDVIHMVTLTHFLEGNPLPPHRLLFSISSKGSFICTFP